MYIYKPLEHLQLKAWHFPVDPLVNYTSKGFLIKLWLKCKSFPRNVILRCEPDNEELQIDMRPKHDEREWILYEGVLPFNRSQSQQNYCFKLLWGDDHIWLGPEGLTRIPIERLRQYSISHPNPHPEWVADQIFYQIFVDRFASSNGDHLVQNHEYLNLSKGVLVRRFSWGDDIDIENASSNFYGGDLDGIISKLDYLMKLSVSALYLTPIFHSPSSHKYDTQDYYNVDAHFGGNKALIRLRKATFSRNMRLILDGVFNHTADSCAWFDRYGLSSISGAAQDEKSPYRNWYSFVNGQGLCWNNNKGLVKLNYSCSEVVNEIYNRKQSVVRTWLREPYSIDGWRLDAAHMLGEHGTAKENHKHLAGIYQAAREENPQAYLLAEHFGDARQWLQGGVEDASMNYSGFALPVRAFLAGVDVAYQPVKIDAAECAVWMDHYRAGIPHQQQLCLFNQLDSHDTSRFITLLNGNQELMTVALCWLYGWIGVPCLFYGTEIGLAGDNDPFNRRPFPWQKPEQWNCDLLNLCIKLGTWRKQSEALRRGGCTIVYAHEHCFIFTRQKGCELWIFALNRGGNRTVEIESIPGVKGNWEKLHGQGILHQQEGLYNLHLCGTDANIWRIFY